MILLRNASIVDGVSTEPRPGMNILIEGEIFREVSVRVWPHGFFAAGFCQVPRQLPVKSRQVLECGFQLRIGRTRRERFELGSLASALGEIGHGGSSRLSRSHYA